MGQAVRHLIFDLDGTLTDPREGITRSMNHALTKMGRPTRELSELEGFIGPPVQEVFAELMQSDDPSVIWEGVRFYRERYSDVGLFENLPFEGIREALRGLSAQGFTLWVCTSKPEEFARRILEKFELAGLFRGICGSEMDGTRSNKGELLGYLLQCEEISGESAAMIGDRKHDAAAARTWGALSVGVLFGFGSESELREAGCAHLCAQPEDLLPLFSHHAGSRTQGVEE